MTQRFVYTTGTITIANGASTVTGTGTAWAGQDRAGAQIWAVPDDAEPFLIGVVAEVDPRGVYDNLSLPLVMAYEGPALTGAAYMLLSGPALANGATQAAIYARFAAHLEQNMGLVGNTADVIDWALVPNNSLFVDAVTRQVLQWRSGVLEPVYSVGAAFNPRGAWADDESYATNDLVSHDGDAYVSNQDGNLNNEPDGADDWWTPVGVIGVDGREVELRVEAGVLEWRYEGGAWDALFTFELASMADVDLDDPEEGDGLVFDGTDWINARVVRSSTLKHAVELTKEAYEALDPPDDNTLYLITPSDD